MKKNHIDITRIAYAIFIIVLIYYSYISFDRDKEKINGLWITKNLKKNWLLSYSSKIVNSKTISKNKYYLRLIDFKTGKIDYKTEITLSSINKIKLLFYTKSSLWLIKNHSFLCLEIPSLKEKYIQDDFLKLIEDSHKEISKIYSVKWIYPYFVVENIQGVTFKISPLEFEKTTDYQNSSDQIAVLNKYYQMGSNVHYSIPFKSRPDSISISLENVNKKRKIEYTPEMNLADKLNADTGYAKNYAVFTPDSSCLLLEGNKRLVLKKLISEEPKLKWSTLMENKIWLRGEFLRPYRIYKDKPSNRYVISKGAMIYIFHHSSLIEKENICRLTAINYKKEKEVWNIDLSEIEDISKYRPTQNYIYKNLLITLWDAKYSYHLTGIDINKGKIIWEIGD